MRYILIIFITLLYSQSSAEPPNVIMMMADDMGWGDPGFNGNTVIKTPKLDNMAKNGVVLDQFYSIGPVCSPTRAACLTGRHNYRTAIWSANEGHLRREEITIAEIVKSKGYATGHFGKWHLGTLSRTISAKGPKRRPEFNYSPPGDHGYDRSFVTESAVTTWNPGIGKRAVNNPFYDDGVAVDPADPDSNVLGGAARVIMDRAIPFIEESVKEDKPFLAVIWFHAPHKDVEAGPEYLAMYPDTGDSAHYYGCITELDEQVGRLQVKLKELGVYENTLQFFSSDNGPEGKDPQPGDLLAGVTGGFRGRKRSSYEGGVRVPTLAVWPGEIPKGSSVDSPACTYDYLPTIAKLVGYQMPDARPLDGEDMLPVIKGERQRKKPILFRHTNKAWIVKGKRKLLISSLTETNKDEMYDLANDPFEKQNIVHGNPELAAEMRKEILSFLDSMESSYEGADYNTSNYEPLDEWHRLGDPKKK